MCLPPPPRLHGVSTHFSSGYIHAVVDAHLHELGVGGVTSRELVDVVEGYTGNGLGTSTKEDSGKVIEGTSLL